MDRDGEIWSEMGRLRQTVRDDEIERYIREIKSWRAMERNMNRERWIDMGRD